MVASTKRVRRAAATVHYFEADGYYAPGDPAHRQASRWHGEAARALGLHGPVKPKRFAQVLQGFVPGTATRLGRLRDGEHQHQPGLDVTFSAPKSVSVEALVYAPARTRARLLNAHDGAVREALDVLEGELLQTRGYDPETRRRPRVPAHGMVAATFRHIVSRNLDPQVHTHSVVANMTRDARKRWRSAKFTRIERSYKLLGAVYRAALQRRVEATGYATVPTMVGGMPGFEIAGYAKGLLGAFSSRRRELLAYLIARGWRYSAAAAQQATLNTRRAKRAEPDREELRNIWRRLAAELGPGRDAQGVRGRGERATGARPPLGAHALVWRAMQHLEERHSVFGADALRAFAIAHGAGAHGLGAIDAEVEALRRDGHLVGATARRADRAFTTARTLAAERRILRALREGFGAGAALADEAAVGARLCAGGLNAGQREAVRTALLSPHRLVGVQGYAGTGKTTMLRELCALADALVVGLAPSASAARVLERETGMAASTLQRFLTRYRDVGDGLATPKVLAQARAALEGALVVLDESSMVSTVQLAALLRIADALGVARLVLVGDRRQLRAVEAGAPFALLQRAGLPTAHMHEVLRQRDPALKAAVAHLIAERPARALEELGPGVIELSGDEDEEEPEDPAQVAAGLWLDLDASAREGTVLLAPTHAQRARINATVREGLAEEGVLHGPVLTIERYVNLHLTRAQKGDLSQYREGDVAVFHAGVPPVRLRAGDACRVLGTQDAQVLLDHPDGKPRHIEPAGYIRYRLELFETETMDLRAGDRVRWTRNAPDHGLVNGERARIAAIGAKRVQFVSEDGRAYALARDDGQLHHLDYAYSSTVHAAQGITCDAVIAVLDADQGPVTDQARFYVELTRARDNVVVLTTDREALIEALETQSAEALSALEAIGAQFAAPPVPAPEPLREKAVHWPALVRWRAFAEAAQRRGDDPFEAEGHEAVLAPILALAQGDGPPEGLPEGLAGVLAEHGARETAAREHVGRVLGALDACLEARNARCEAAAASRQAVTALPGHAAWGRRVASALGRARALCPEAVGRVEGGAQRLASAVAALERARGLDTRAAALLDDWERFCKRATRAAHPFVRRSGYTALHRRIVALSREATHSGEMPPVLARALAEHGALAADRETVRRSRRALREDMRLRDALVGEAHAKEEALTQLADYASWRTGAVAACATARRALEGTARRDAARKAAPWRGPGAARERLGLQLRALERALDFDARAAALLEDWRALEARPGFTIPFYRKGYGELLARMQRLAAGALARHRVLVTERDTVLRGYQAVRACVERRTALLDEAVKERRAITDLDGYARWRDDAMRALSAGDPRFAVEPRYRAHWPALHGEQELGMSACDELRLMLDWDERAERLRRNWNDHVRRAREKHHDPFDGEAGAQLLDCVGASNHPGDMPPWLTEARAQYRAFVADRDTVAQARNALLACVAQRTGLLADAGYAWRALTDLDGYPRWRKAAQAARLRADAVVGAERRYRPHLEGIGETWREFADAAQALARGLEYDDRAREAARQCARFDKLANASGRHPFYQRGFDALYHDTKPLADECTHPAEVPPRCRALLAWPSQLARETRAALERSQSTRARLAQGSRAQAAALWEHAGYAPWRERAERARANARQALAESARFAAHLDAPEEWRAALTRATQAVDAGLAFDARGKALLERRRRLGPGAGPAAAPSAFYAPGYDPYIAEAKKLAASAGDPAEVPAVLTRDLDAHGQSIRAQQRARAHARALEKHAHERRALLETAAAHRQALTEHEDYAALRNRADAACADARAMIDDEAAYGPHLEALEGARQGFVQSAEALERGLDLDARSAPLGEAWRNHHLAATAAGVHPMDHERYAKLAERVMALDTEATGAGAARSPLAGLIARHREYETDRATVKRARETILPCAGERGTLLDDAHAAGQALAERDAYGPWAARAREARALWTPLRADEARYRAHATGLGESWEDLEGAAAALERGLGLDGRGTALGEAWHAHHQAAAAAGMHPLDHPGYANVIEAMTALDAEATGAGEARSPVAGLLARHHEYETDRDTVRRAREAISICAGERDVLLDDAHAAGQALTERDAYGPWAARAREACALWAPLRADEARYRAHVTGLGGSSEDLENAAESLKRGLGLDTRSAPLGEAWRDHHHAAAAARMHPLDHPGYAGVIEDMTALDAEATGAGEARSPVAGLLARHREYEADRATVQRAREIILPCAGERDTLLDDAHAARQALTERDAYGPWAVRAREACGLWTLLHTDEARYRVHATGLGGSWEDLEGAAGAIERGLELDARSAPLGETWRTHHQAASTAGMHPLDHPGYTDIVEAMTAFDAEATGAGEARSPLSGLLARHREYETDRATVSRARETILPCAGERATLLDDAHAAGQALTERGAYGSWAARAREACGLWTPLRADETRYRAQAKGLDGSWGDLEGAAEALERGLDLDARSRPVAEAWRDHHRAATTAGAHPMDHDGYAALVERVTALDAEATGAGAARSPLAGLIARHREYETDRATVKCARNAILHCAWERGALLDDAHAAGRALTEQYTYGSWAAGARKACALWAPLRADETRYRAHAAGLGGSWEVLESAAAGLERGLDFDARSRPVAEAWRAHHRAATAGAVHPLDHPGYTDLIEDMTALDAEATGAGAARSPLAGPLARHHEYREERERATRTVAEVAALAQQRITLLDETVVANCVVWGNPAYPEWRSRADIARAEAKPLLDDAARYRPHVEAGAGDWTQFAADTAALDAARTFDRRSQALAKACSNHVIHRREAGIFFLPGHEAVIAQIERHCREACHPGEVSPALTARLNGHKMFAEDRAHVTGTPAELEARIEERRRLAHETGTGGRAPVEHAAHADWAERSEETLGRWRLVRDETLYRRHVEATPQGDGAFRRTCASLAEALDRQLDFDREASETLKMWHAHREAAGRAHRHPFHHQGYGEVYARIEALDQAAPTPREVPRALQDVLERHPQLTADRDTVVTAERALAGRIEERRDLLRGAVREGVGASHAPGYTRWRQDVRQALGRAHAILGNEPRYGLHGVALRDGMDAMRRQTKALERALEVDDVAERLYRDGVQGRGGSARTPTNAAVGRDAVDQLEQEVASLRARGLLPGELHPGVEAALERHRERLEKKPARKHVRGAGMGYGW